MAKTILIIEDDESLRRVTEFQLTEAGYLVTTASDGQAGLEAMRRELPDLVLTDVQMPGMGGDQVLKAIRSEWPEVLVVMMTAFGTVERAVEAMRNGAHDYLTKPFSKDALLMAVQRALAFSGLKQENRRLRDELSGQQALDELVGISEPMRQLREMISRIAASESTLLLLGESGTGKELVARAIHRGSPRARGPFVTVNCAAIPKELLESELFGHLKGSFTGALRDREGKFSQADGGTIFLDEVGELPIELQPKLLRALQEMEVEPVGGKPKKVDVRVVAATNRDLVAAIGAGLFREDLYYRLAVIPLELPPLRERGDDVPLLVNHFLARHNKDKDDISPAAMQLLCQHDWPGNVRELENCIERMLVLSRGAQLEPEDLPPAILARPEGDTCGVLNLPAEGYPLEQLEKDAVEQALERCHGNQSQAARFLQIPRHTLLYRIEKYGIGKP